MEQHIKDFINYLRTERGIAGESIKQYAWELDKFNKFVNKEVSAVTTNNIREYLAHLTTEHKYKPKSINRRLACIKSFFKYLTMEKVVSENPVLRISSQKVAKKIPIYLTEEEVSRILNVAKEDDRNYFIIYLMVHTGLRLSELTALNVEDIDLNAKTLIVKHGKGDKQRSISLGANSITICDNYFRKIGKTSGPIFSAVKQRIDNNTVRYMLRDVCRKAGITKKITPHRLRSTFATLLLKKGVSIYEISKLLGHENISTTQIYATLDTETLKNAIDKLEDIA